MAKSLIYIHDPMCSWCFGFEPTRRKLFDRLAERNIPVRRYVGGLAPDSDLPMPESMRAGLQQTWRRIEAMIPGTRFNHDFWARCEPRRSTYPANRAVIVARAQDEKFDLLMTRRIQQAYYEEARNPSDNDTLIELAGDIGLDAIRFAADLTAASTELLLGEEIRFTRSIGVDSFPSLVVDRDGSLTPVNLSYTDAEAMFGEIDAA